MYWGLIACSFVAFSASTEFIPELNTKLRLVPFSTEFKMVMTATMVVDFVGCWVVEQVLKRAFSDFRPKPIALRRPDQLAREEARRREEEMKMEREKAEKIEKANGTA
jgi:manganese-transporting P-type ATPase